MGIFVAIRQAWKESWETRENIRREGTEETEETIIEEDRTEDDEESKKKKKNILFSNTARLHWPRKRSTARKQDEEGGWNQARNEAEDV